MLSIYLFIINDLVLFAIPLKLYLLSVQQHAMLPAACKKDHKHIGAIFIITERKLKEIIQLRTQATRAH